MCTDLHFLFFFHQTKFKINSKIKKKVMIYNDDGDDDEN